MTASGSLSDMPTIRTTHSRTTRNAVGSIGFVIRRTWIRRTRADPGFCRMKSYGATLRTSIPIYGIISINILCRDYRMNQQPQNDHALLGRSQFDRGALRQQSYSTDAQAVETKVSRNPATQYLVISSKDRNQTSTVSSQVLSPTGQPTTITTQTYVRQPWNNFKLQRPQSLMQTYATRMLISEINFPFYVPNVNINNNKIWVIGPSTSPGNPIVIFLITLNPGYYSPNAANTAGTVSLATALNSIMANATTYGTVAPVFPAGSSGTLANPPVVSVNPNNSFSWTLTGALAGGFALFATGPLANGATFAPLTEIAYYSNSSLALLMGMDFRQVNGTTLASNINPVLIGNPTTLQYTQYIDIVSDKLHQYTTNRDGSSDNTFSRNLLCRLYISDEASNIVEGFSISGDGGGPISSTPVQFIPGVTGPFIIHRQFKNAKAVMWNKEASVDWLDIAVYDEFGNLLPLGTNTTIPPPYSPLDPVYPDFQITLLASEN
jgi:hypothetical protein